MDIELFRDFIDYLDNKEIIYTIDNLSIDADNTINLNRKKYKLLSFSNIQEILENKIKSDIKNNNFNFLKQTIPYTVYYIDKDKLINYILENINDFDIFYEKDKNYQTIKKFVENIKIHEIVYNYLDLDSDTICSLVTLNDEDILSIIRDFQYELLEYYKKQINKLSDYSYLGETDLCFIFVKDE